MSKFYISPCIIHHEIAKKNLLSELSEKENRKKFYIYIIYVVPGKQNNTSGLICLYICLSFPLAHFASADSTNNL